MSRTVVAALVLSWAASGYAAQPPEDAKVVAEGKVLRVDKDKGEITIRYTLKAKSSDKELEKTIPVDKIVLTDRDGKKLTGADVYGALNEGDPIVIPHFTKGEVHIRVKKKE